MPEPDSTSGNEPPNRNNYDDCINLNKKLQQLVKTHVGLVSILLALIESVDVPGSPKLEGSMYHLDDGETKKAILERINLLLARAGLANCPGAMGDLLYNELFMQLCNYKK